MINRLRRRIRRNLNRAYKHQSKADYYTGRARVLTTFLDEEADKVILEQFEDELTRLGNGLDVEFEAEDD